MSWSFRKDCIGFARSILDPFGSELEKKRSDTMRKGEENEEESLNHLLCVLIGYFVSTVSHDIDEWLTWGTYCMCGLQFRCSFPFYRFDVIHYTVTK